MRKMLTHLPSPKVRLIAVRFILAAFASSAPCLARPAVAAEAGEGAPTAKADTAAPKPRVEAKLDSKTYDRYVGRYELAPGFIIEVTREGDRLMTQATGQPKVEIFPESETEWFLKVTDAQVSFVKDGSGAFTKLILHQGGRDMPAPRVGEIPKLKPGTEPAAHPQYWDKYVGTYQLSPEFMVTITIEDGHLMAQATAQPKIEIFEKSETEYFYKVVDAQITFERGAEGKVERLVLHQGGQNVPGPKMK